MSPRARLGAVILVLLAIAAAAVALTRNDEEPVANGPNPREEIVADPLRPQLRRCQLLGEAATRDPACLRAWADNRERFLAPVSSPAVPPAASPLEIR